MAYGTVLERRLGIASLVCSNHTSSAQYRGAGPAGDGDRLISGYSQVQLLGRPPARYSSAGRAPDS